MAQYTRRDVASDAVRQAYQDLPRSKRPDDDGHDQLIAWVLTNHAADVALAGQDLDPYSRDHREYNRQEQLSIDAMDRIADAVRAAFPR